MDKAQIAGYVRWAIALISGGSIGAYLMDHAPWLLSFLTGNVEFVVSAIVALLGLIWSHFSNTPVALTQQLIANPNVSNDNVAAVIKKGDPAQVTASKIAA